MPCKTEMRAVRWLLAVALQLTLVVVPLWAQQPTPKPPAAPTPPVQTELSFDNILADDRYKIYAEVRNVGYLLNTGGAGEIVEPILKLADPGPQFKSIISFLKKNSELLGSSRMMFGFWRTRTDVPEIFAAIEFPNSEDAAKFAPKLETFLPTVLPPVTLSAELIPDPELPAPDAKVRVAPSPSPTPEPQPRFVISRHGELVFLSDKEFKLEKLHPPTSQSLFKDQNFRLAHDKFSSEPVFVYFNIELEEQKPPPTTQPKTKAEAEAAAEAERVKREEEEARTAELAAAMANASPEPTPPPQPMPQTETRGSAVLIAQSPSPTPTPTREEKAMQVASNQLGQLFDLLGFGEPQMPLAVGAALALEGNEYIVRALVIDKPDAKKQLIPFVPQLISGAPYTADAPSVLPDDTEVFVSASIDLVQTYEGMRRAAELKAKSDAQPKSSVYKDGVMIAQRGAKEQQPDLLNQFEKKAGFKIKDDLLSALGNEIAFAGSLKTLQGASALGIGVPTPPSKETTKEEAQKQAAALPILLIKVKDRDAVRRLMPQVLNGLGIPEANLIAQNEKHGDAEMMNYAGIFAYAFVGDFMALSDAVTIRNLIDANTGRRTLSANSVFHNSRRWQSQRTLGQVYVSPAMMEGYQDEVRKQSATMDAELRDFLLALDPRSEALTYALSNDGLGTHHELRLPKNLILTMVAGFSSATKNPPPEVNEAVAPGLLSMIASAQSQYKEGQGKGSYGSMQQLQNARLLGSPEMFDRYGYKFDVTVTADGFEAVATPREYGKTGKRSFFVDKSGVVRGGDHGGGPATVADPPVEG